MAAEMGRGHEDSNLQLCLHRPAYASAESVDLPNLLTRTNEEGEQQRADVHGPASERTTLRRRTPP